MLHFSHFSHPVPVHTPQRNASLHDTQMAVYHHSTQAVLLLERESDTTRLRVSSEIDDGRKVYEVRFDVEGTEYDYEISGRDGQILSADTERISTVDTTDRAGTTDTAGTADTAGTTDKEKSGNSQNNAQALGISIEEAEKIALERVPGASENDIRIQSDYDDGKYKYEGDFIYDGKEYEFDIDASTGTILEWSEERY